MGGEVAGFQVQGIVEVDDLVNSVMIPGADVGQGCGQSGAESCEFLCHGRGGSGVVILLVRRGCAVLGCDVEFDGGLCSEHGSGPLLSHVLRVGAAASAAAPDADHVLVVVELDLLDEEVPWVGLRVLAGEFGYEAVGSPDGFVAGVGG